MGRSGTAQKSWNGAALLARGTDGRLLLPTALDVYAPERWRDDVLFRPEIRSAFHRLMEQGWVDALRTLHPGERIYTFWDYFRKCLCPRCRFAH